MQEASFVVTGVRPGVLMHSPAGMVGGAEPSKLGTRQVPSPTTEAEACAYRLPDGQLAASLHLTVERLGEIQLRKTTLGPGDHLVPIKHTLAQHAGRRLSSLQLQGNEHAGGMSPLYYLNQVINLLEHDLLDRDDPVVRERLARIVALAAPVGVGS